MARTGRTPRANARRTRTRSGSRTRAARADLHSLYERAVHDAGAEIDFIRDTYKALRGRHALTFREDFSGPSSSACEWVRRGPKCRAIAVDFDPSVLEWARRHHVAKLTPARRRRLRLVEANVLSVRTPAVDVVAALNFSYWIFKDRRTLLRYFRAARRALRKGGLLVLDAFGGHEASKEMRERTKLRGFTYVWHQAAFQPVTNEILCHIHFTFPDGSRLEKAFTYDWRLWSLAEIRELLAEAGFARSTVYWEGDDGKGGGNGEFTPTVHGESDAGWIAYIVAER